MADLLAILVLAGALGWLTYRDEMIERDEDTAWEDLRRRLEHDGSDRQP